MWAIVGPTVAAVAVRASIPGGGGGKPMWVRLGGGEEAEEEEEEEEDEMVTSLHDLARSDGWDGISTVGCSAADSGVLSRS
ncbi:hypothetical protein ACLOJK_039256, partial [Asimina triloba]